MKRAKLSETSMIKEGKEPVNPLEGVWMLPGFGNTGVVETSEGMVLVDVPGHRDELHCPEYFL